MKFGFVYVWENRKSGKKYIGSHYGSKNDGYVSSSIYFNEIYELEKDDFIRNILVDGLTRDQALRKEMALLKHNNAAKSEEFYNLHNCPGRGWSHHDDPSLSKIYYGRISESKKGKPAHNKGKSIWTDENKHKLKTDLWLVRDPDGNENKIENMNQFCKIHDLNPSAMSRVARGVVNQHKGFWCKKLSNNRNVDYEYKEWVSKGHESKANFGSKNGCSKEIEVNGIKYSCMREASEKTGLSMYKLRKLRN